MEMLMALSQAESSRDVPLDGQRQQMPGKASDDPRFLGLFRVWDCSPMPHACGVSQTSGAS